MRGSPCACHGEPKFWDRGYWKCYVKYTVAHRRALETYRATEKGKRMRAMCQHRYYRRGGWVMERKRKLRKERARVAERLERLGVVG